MCVSRKIEYEVPILIVGFNRPEMLYERIEEALATHCQCIYVSIDGGINDAKIERKMEVLCQHFSKNERLILIRHTTNLGLSKHLVNGVSEILAAYSAIVVIEDDIKISPIFYSSLVNALTNWNSDFFAVGGFSPLWGSKIFPNRWRKSKYVSIWGWGITRENWQKYSPVIDAKTFHEKLLHSKVWRKLSKREKKIWISRFTKVAKDPSYTWDTQIQYASFAHNLNNIQSLWRISENVGFNNELSTNTKGKRPLLYGAESLSSKEIPFDGLIQGRIANLIEILDRIVVVGIYKFRIKKLLKLFSRRESDLKSR